MKLKTAKEILCKHVIPASEDALNGMLCAMEEYLAQSEEFFVFNNTDNKSLNDISHEYAKENSINGVDYKLVKRDFKNGYIMAIKDQKNKLTKYHDVGEFYKDEEELCNSGHAKIVEMNGVKLLAISEELFDKMSNTTDELNDIGDLKEQFVHPDPERQKLVSYSASEISGNISLAYYRGIEKGKKLNSNLKTIEGQSGTKFHFDYKKSDAVEFAAWKDRNYYKMDQNYYIVKYFNDEGYMDSMKDAKKFTYEELYQLFLTETKK